jgi:hypothetical protein
MPVIVTLRRVALLKRLPYGIWRLASALLLACSAWAGLYWPRAAWAAPSGVTLVIHAGFDGYYKDQRWLPVRITVANDGPDAKGTLSVAVPRNNGSAAVIVTRDVDLPTQSRREIFLYVPTEGFVSNLQVSLSDANKDLATATTRVVQAGPGDLIYGVLAGSPSSFNVLSGVKPVSGSAFVAQLDIADLPPVSHAWRALDVLVVSDVDTGALSPEQRSAMAEWVASGGRLIVAGGPTWQKTAAGLGALLPLVPSGTQTLADTSALAAFAASTAAAGPAIAATGALGPDAVTLASAGDVPIILARHSGFGQVMFLAIDPSFDPLKNWSGQEGMYRNLLSGTAQRPNWAEGLRNWYSARDAINALPGLQLPSPLAISGFLGLYVLAVGPINYLILRRVKRRELAWLTVPALVVVFSAGAYFTGYQLRGGQPSLHRLAVVQVWPDAGQARVDGLVGLFSPRRSQYDIAFGPGFLARPMPIDSGSPGANTFTVQQSDGTLIRAVRMEVGAVEPFVVQGQVPAPAFDSNLTLDVNTSQVTLRGTVTNHSDVALKDTVLLAPGAVQRLGNLGPGASASISLPLTGSHATLAAANDILPAQAGGAGQTAAPPSAPSNYDSTIDDILGNTYYYNDREQFRRYSLLSSIIDTYSGNVRGNGVYLVGWSNQSPVVVTLANRSFQTTDSSLYLVSLQPKLNLGTGSLAIPPGLMTWISLEPSPSVSPTPYDLYLYQNTGVTLRFTPAQILPHDKVQGLTMHLLSYGQTGTATVNIDLWDFTVNDWVRQPQQSWGDSNVSGANQFVGPAGEIQVRAFNPVSQQVSLERLDFTLLVGQ